MTKLKSLNKYFLRAKESLKAVILASALALFSLLKRTFFKLKKTLNTVIIKVFLAFSIFKNKLEIVSNKLVKYFIIIKKFLSDTLQRDFTAKILVHAFSTLFFLLLFLISKNHLVTIIGLSLVLFLIFFSKKLSIVLKKQMKVDYSTYGKLLYAQIDSPQVYVSLLAEMLMINLITIMMILFSLIAVLPYVFNYLPFFLLFLIPPLAITLYFFLLPSLRESSINSKVDEELPIASMLITAFSSSNLHPYKSLEVVSNIYFFKGFRRIFMLLEKIRIFLMKSPIETLDIFSNYVRHGMIKKLFRNLSSVGLGISVYDLMRDYMRDAFSTYEKKAEEMVDRFSVILAAKILIFVVFPITMVIMVSFMQGISISLVFFTSFIFPIIFFSLFMVIVKGTLPSFLRLDVRINLYSLALASTIPVFLILNLSGFLSMSNSILFALAIMLGGFWIINMKRARESSQLIKELPMLVNDIAEEIKKGKNLYLALEEIGNRYERASALMSKLIFFRRMGFSMEEIIKRENLPAFFSKVFVALEECEKVGINPVVIKEFSDFTSKLDSIRKVFSMRIRFFKISSIMISILLGFGLGVSLGVLTTLVTIFKEIAATSGFSPLVNINIPLELFREVMLSSGYINATLLGFLGGYSENSVEGAKIGFICLIMSAIALYFSTLIGITLIR